MNSKVQTLKGFRDFFGEAARKRQWLLNEIKSVFETYGFEPLETPTLEYEELLLGKYGDEAEKLIYSFEDRGGRRIALKYDQTVPMTRVIAQYQRELPMPYRKYQMQPVWRADKPQKGRYREFFQCDADIIGSTDSTADADILAVFYGIFVKIGIKSIVLKINDRKTLLQSIKDSGVPEQLVLPTVQTIDKLGKKTANEVIEELEGKGVSSAESVLRNVLGTKPSENLKEIMQKAEELGVPTEAMQYEPSLARGLDYYTGMIFEGMVPEYNVGSVGGGGRYDKLINDLVGVDLPAVGFGLGFDRTLEAAEAFGIFENISSDSTTLVTVFSEDLAEKSRKVTLALRNAGISAEIYSENDKMQKQLKYANKKNITNVVIIGPDEAKVGKTVLKNMNSGDQKTLSINELIAELSE